MKAKTLNNTGVLLDEDGRELVTFADYRIKAPPSGEVEEWGGLLMVLAELPMDVEYTLELDTEDGRSGRIKLESEREVRRGGMTVHEYAFKGISSLM